MRLPGHKISVNSVNFFKREKVCCREETFADFGIGFRFLLVVLQNEQLHLIMDLEVIKSKIYEIRGQRVMLDRDLAQMYGVETKVLNQAVRRNLERFPEDFMFMLTQTECKSLEISVRSQFVTSKSGGNRYSSLAFTEQGVAMLSSVLRSKTAIEINISIMRAFVTIRNFAFSISAVTSELTEFKERMLQIEQCCKDNGDAVSDLSEDMQQELDDIYLALSQLAAKQKDNDGLKERQKIGFKK